MKEAFQEGAGYQAVPNGAVWPTTLRYQTKAWTMCRVGFHRVCQDPVPREQLRRKEWLLGILKTCPGVGNIRGCVYCPLSVGTRPHGPSSKESVRYDDRIIEIMTSDFYSKRLLIGTEGRTWLMERQVARDPGPEW